MSCQLLARVRGSITKQSTDAPNLAVFWCFDFFFESDLERAREADSSKHGTHMDHQVEIVCINITAVPHARYLPWLMKLRVQSEHHKEYKYNVFITLHIYKFPPAPFLRLEMTTTRYTNGSVKYPPCVQNFVSKFRGGVVKSPTFRGGGKF